MRVGTATVAHSPLATWFAVGASIPAWAAHLLYAASVVELTCEHPGWEWTLHAATVVTAAVTVVAMWMALGLLEAGQDAESSGTRAGQLRFLGLLGLLVGGIDLALILLEGSFAIFIGPCD